MALLGLVQPGVAAAALSAGVSSQSIMNPVRTRRPALLQRPVEAVLPLVGGELLQHRGWRNRANLQRSNEAENVAPVLAARLDLDPVAHDGLQFGIARDRLDAGKPPAGTLVILATGALLMRLLHITSGAVAVAGGIILALLAVRMASGPGEGVKEGHLVPEGRRIAVYPLAIPYLLNPPRGSSSCFSPAPERLRRCRDLAAAGGSGQVARTWPPPVICRSGPWPHPLPAGCCSASVAVAHGLLPLALGAVLIVCVLAAVHHAEVVAHRVGEPFGTLVLALAITMIEVALIVSLMLAGGPATAALARDTVFAAVMIILNGIVGSACWRAARAMANRSSTCTGSTRRWRRSPPWPC